MTGDKDVTRMDRLGMMGTGMGRLSRCQDPYFHTLTVGRQCNVSRVLLCSSGLALGLRPLLSSLVRAILTGIQSVSAALPLAPVCGSLIFCGGLLDGSGVR
jgi:hypothetical protein